MNKKLKELKEETTKPTINIGTITAIVKEIYKKVGIWGLVAIAFGVLGIVMFVMPHWFNLPWPWFAVIGGCLCGASFVLCITFGTIYAITHYKLQVLKEKAKIQENKLAVEQYRKELQKLKYINK